MLLKPIKAILITAVFLVAAVTGWIVRALSAPAGRTAGGESAVFEVGKGWSARAVLDRLGRDGLVRDPVPLRLACRIFYPEERFKAGEYLFSPPLPAKAALFRIFGAHVHLEPLTVPEGLTGDEIAALLRPGDAEKAAAFRRAMLDPGPIADLDPRARDLEGYLFPETYNLPRQAPDVDIVAAMVSRFREVFDEPRRRRAAEIGLSVRDVVTLASLIEKETAIPAERPLVSAVFHNRLRIGMKLDCDPTVVYALKREGLYKGRLLLKDLKFPSPYNTYLHAGLPPGPIANPGLASLDAALTPSSDAYLYFVARGDGSHRFSRTLGEHLEAVKRFRALQIH
jgi:UPF0755 protein